MNFSSKHLIEDEQDFIGLKEFYEGLSGPKHQWSSSPPTSYPCVCVCIEWDNPNGPIEVYAEYVYTNDFIK